MQRDAARDGSDTFLRLLLVVPSLVFVAANVLKFELSVDAPYDFLRPIIGSHNPFAEIAVAAVVLLGPAATVLLTLRRTASLSVSRSNGRVDAKASLSARWRDIAILGLAVASLGAIGLYLIAENL